MEHESAVRSAVSDAEVDIREGVVKSVEAEWEAKCDAIRRDADRRVADTEDRVRRQVEESMRAVYEARVAG